MRYCAVWLDVRYSAVDADHFVDGNKMVDLIEINRRRASS